MEEWGDSGEKGNKLGVVDRTSKGMNKQSKSSMKETWVAKSVKGVGEGRDNWSRIQNDESRCKMTRDGGALQTWSPGEKSGIEMTRDGDSTIRRKEEQGEWRGGSKPGLEWYQGEEYENNKRIF